jgi:hypothetical protein
MTSPVKSLSVREDNDGAICIHKKVKAGVYESVSDFWFKIEKLVQFEKSLAGNSGDEIFVQAYLDQNLTHKGKGLLLLTNCQPMFAL